MRPTRDCLLSDMIRSFRVRALLYLGLVLLIPAAQAATSVSGFVNAEYNQFNIGNKSADPGQNPPFGGFDLQRVGIDFQADQDIFTAIAQLQIENGAQFSDSGNGAGANASSNIGFGEVSLERGWIQARFNRSFKLKFGKDQTPTLWERAHYPSIYPSITQPQIEENVFEEYLVGMMASGDLSYGFLYDVWLSKAEPTTTALTNGGQLLVTDNKTLAPTEGGRFGWQKDSKNTSLYLGVLAAQYHDTPRQFVSGFEANVRYGKTTVWFEYNHGLQTNGWYILPQYEIALIKNMYISPYFLIDSFTDINVGSQARRVYAIGVNFKPKSYLTIKAEGVLTAANNGIEQQNEALRLGVIYYFN